MKTMKCEAFKCWCGNKEIKIIESVKNDDGVEIYRKLDGGGAYIANEGYTEHWKNESDMLNEYPKIKEEND
ncbi:MAG: hypothetical protein WC365_08040 [Candidatus Babeliales bacterium]|jgi:hypothetical protein